MHSTFIPASCGLILVLLLSLLACDEAESKDGLPDASPEAVDAQPAACTYQGFTATTEAAERDDDLGVLFYTAQSGQFPAMQVLNFDLYFDIGASDMPHEFSFSGEDLADCHTCLVMRRDCGAPNCSGGKAFLVQEGQVNITGIGSGGTPLQGQFQDLKLAEATISITSKATLVPSGETWCLDSYTFDKTIMAP